jgi:AcrR family transcriptional regulator
MRSQRSTARLSLDAIVAAGVAIADDHGLETLSMRRLAHDLGVNPMSLYHHVQDKDALLDAMVDSVVLAIAPVAASASTPWTEELRSLLLSARRAVLRHPWSVTVFLERDTPTEAVLQHIENVLDILRRGGCSVALIHHALHLFGSRILGFSQNLFDESARSGSSATGNDNPLEWAASFPNVVELAAAVNHDGGLGGCDDDDEFDFALEIILEGIEVRRAAEAAER